MKNIRSDRNDSFRGKGKGRNETRQKNTSVDSEKRLARREIFVVIILVLVSLAAFPRSSPKGWDVADILISNWHRYLETQLHADGRLIP